MGTKSNARDDHGQRTTVPYPRPLSGHAGRRAKRGVVQAHRQGARSDSGESGPLRPPRLRTGLQEVPRGSRTGGEPKRSDRLAERVAGRSEAVIFHSVVPLGLRDGGTARRGAWGSAGKSFRMPGQQRGVRVLSRERGLGRKDSLVLRFWRAAGASQVGESSRDARGTKGFATLQPMPVTLTFFSTRGSTIVLGTSSRPFTRPRGETRKFWRG